MPGTQSDFAELNKSSCHISWLLYCVMYFLIPISDFYVFRCLCSTMYFWFLGLLLCHTPSCVVSLRVSALSGRVWSSFAKCCTSCKPLSPRTFLSTVPWWALKIGDFSWLVFREVTQILGNPHPQAHSDQPLSHLLPCWICPGPSPLPLWSGTFPSGPTVSVCTKVEEKNLSSSNLSNFFFLNSSFSSFQPNENQTNIPIHQLNKSQLYSAPIDPTEWVGLRKSSPLLVYLRVRPPLYFTWASAQLTPDLLCLENSDITTDHNLAFLRDIWSQKQMTRHYHQCPIVKRNWLRSLGLIE